MMVMIGQGPQASAAHPITLRTSPVGTWLFVVMAALFAFALVRGYLGAATSAGRVGVVIFMGAFFVLCILAATVLLIRRSTLEISADAITYYGNPTARSKALGVRQLVLDRSSGDELSVVLSGPQGRQRPGLTIPGSGTTLPLNLFSADRVKRACLARGWHFSA